MVTYRSVLYLQDNGHMLFAKEDNRNLREDSHTMRKVLAGDTASQQGSNQ